MVGRGRSSRGEGGLLELEIHLVKSATTLIWRAEHATARTSVPWAVFHVRLAPSERSRRHASTAPTAAAAWSGVHRFPSYQVTAAVRATSLNSGASMSRRAGSILEGRFSRRARNSFRPRVLPRATHPLRGRGQRGGFSFFGGDCSLENPPRHSRAS